MEKLNIEQRTKKTHHEARKTRKAGKVPGILYGKAVQNTLFEVGALELDEYVMKEGTSSVASININGEDHKALIKEVQRDPLTRKIIHIDLEQIEAGKQVVANVPVNFVGEEKLLKSKAVLQKQKDSIKVKCDADNLPKFINCNIGEAKIGESFRLSDVEFASEISILDDLECVIATISCEQKVEEVPGENGIPEPITPVE